MIINYIEVNAICIAFLLLFRLHLRNLDTSSSKQRILITMIWSTVLLCVSDMVAGVFRGMTLPGTKMILEASNGLYFEMLVIISYEWCVYAYTRLMPDKVVSRKIWAISSLPVVVFAVLALTNPLTHYLFTITPENLYKRGNGVFLHWVVVWTLFLLPSVKALRLYMKETSAIKKQEIQPLLLFAISPFVASMIQMLFYGVTTTQVGITISIAMICLKSQEAQILTDSLTGINNRRALTSFMENQMQHDKDAVYTLVMIDVNHFKQINDKYGHMMGDVVLKRIAAALKEACKVLSSRVQISRFGGDEFIILGIDCTDDELNLLVDAIATEIEKQTRAQNIPCEVSASIGYTQGKCTKEKDFRELLGAADEAMYQQKAEHSRK